MTIVLQTPLFTQEVPENGAAKGHVRFVSATTKVDDVALIGLCASITASLLYRTLKAAGTNVIITLSEEGVRADVLARYEDDGVNVQWPLKPGDPAQLDSVQERIRAKTFFIKPPARKDTMMNDAAMNVPGAGPQDGTPGAAALPSSSAPPGAPLDAESEEAEEYQVKQLHRVP
jgi:hypothetical protein